MSRPGGNPDRPPLPPGKGRPKGSKNKLTRERVEEELRYLAFSNIVDAFDGIHGNRRTFTLREIRKMPESFQRCIQSVKVRTENLTPGDDAQDTTIEIKLWPKDRALEMCGRALGLFKDRIEMSAPDELLSRLDRAKERARAKKGEA